MAIHKVRGWPDAPQGMYLGQRSRGGWRSCLGCVGAAMLAGLMLVVGVLGWGLAHLDLSPGPGPVPPDDLNAVARSATVALAAAPTAARATADLDAVTTVVPGGRIGADAILDRCQGAGGSASQGYAGPIRCGRATQRVLGGRGDPRAALLAVDRALRARGWSSGNGGALVLPPGPLPDVSYTYTDPTRATLTVALSPAAGPGGTADRADAPLAHLDLPPLPPTDDPTVAGLRTAQPGPPESVLVQAYLGHSFLIGVELLDDYWAGSPEDV